MGQSEERLVPKNRWELHGAIPNELWIYPRWLVNFYLKFFIFPDLLLPFLTGKAEPTLPSAPSQPETDALAEEASKKAKKAEESKKRAQWFEEDEVKKMIFFLKFSDNE